MSLGKLFSDGNLKAKMIYVYISDVGCPKFQGTILKPNMTYVYISDVECGLPVQNSNLKIIITWIEQLSKFNCETILQCTPNSAKHTVLEQFL